MQNIEMCEFCGTPCTEGDDAQPCHWDQWAMAHARENSLELSLGMLWARHAGVSLYNKGYDLYAVAA